MQVEHQGWVAVLSIGLLILSLGGIKIWRWYFNLVSIAQTRVRHQDGHLVPVQPLQFLIGHLGKVYRAENRLDAYHQFHENCGDIVQIFWLWRQQISIANLDSIRHVLVKHQNNYRKFPPNRLIQRLYGYSVLTNHGRDWQRQRMLIQGLFTPHQIQSFHPTFVSCTDQLVTLWSQKVQSSRGDFQTDIYPDLMALFLETISQSAFGTQLDALHGNMGKVLSSIHLILEQSTHPLYQFVSWWQHLPLPKNRQIHQAFRTIDDFLYGLIRDRRERLRQGTASSETLLDLMIQEGINDEQGLLSDREVRDNLLAIMINGYETVATSVAFSLDLLARHPEYQQNVQAEVDRLFSQQPDAYHQLVTLPGLNRVIVESLRLCPPMAGLQRISSRADWLGPWSIPAEQAIGIPFRPVHLNAQHYGDQPQQFRPERYDGTVSPAPDLNGKSGCPIKRFLGRDSLGSIESPLTFGDGARQCLGATFALHEMAIALGMLLYRFEFLMQPGDGAEMELGKFGLFISMKPKHGVRLTLRERPINHSVEPLSLGQFQHVY